MDADAIKIKIGQTVQRIVAVVLVVGGGADIAQDFQVAETVVAEFFADVVQGITVDIAVTVDTAADDRATGDADQPVVFRRAQGLVLPPCWTLKAMWTGYITRRARVI